MTELEKLQAGEYYKMDDPEIAKIQNRAIEMCERLREIPFSDVEARAQWAKEVFGSVGKNVSLKPGFWCDMGVNIHVGDNFLTNYNVVILDMGKVTIGDNVWIGPGSKLLAVAHPIEAEGRRSGLGIAKPITLGNGVWLGANVTVTMGVTIGDNAVIGAGAVVTHDVPANAVVAGVPAKVLRYIDNKPDLWHEEN